MSQAAGLVIGAEYPPEPSYDFGLLGSRSIWVLSLTLEVGLDFKIRMMQVSLLDGERKLTKDSKINQTSSIIQRQTHTPSDFPISRPLKPHPWPTVDLESWIRSVKVNFVLIAFNLKFTFLHYKLKSVSKRDD